MSREIRETEPPPGWVHIDVVSGVEGHCLAVGGHVQSERVAGPKSWGGGHVVERFTVEISRLEEALASHRAMVSNV